MHQYTTKKILIKKFLKLIRSSFFIKLVVISNVLKICTQNGYLNDSLIEVNHDAADQVKILTPV